jgi:hypothetical protein
VCVREREREREQEREREHEREREIIIVLKAIIPIYLYSQDSFKLFSLGWDVSFQIFVI